MTVVEGSRVPERVTKESIEGAVLRRRWWLVDGREISDLEKERLETGGVQAGGIRVNRTRTEGGWTIGELAGETDADVARAAGRRHLDTIDGTQTLIMARRRE